MKFINEITFVPTTRLQPSLGVDVMYQMTNERVPQMIGRMLWSDSMDCYHFTAEEYMGYVPMTEGQLQQILDKLMDMNLNHKPKEEEEDDNQGT